MDDLISRQAAIDTAIEWLKCRLTDRKNGESLIDRLKHLPSAESEYEHTMEEFMFGQDMGNPEDGSL